VFDLLDGLNAMVHAMLEIPLYPPLPKGEVEILPFVKGRHRGFRLEV
jgi:hypothetical protein